MTAPAAALTPIGPPPLRGHVVVHFYTKDYSWSSAWSQSFDDVEAYIAEHPEIYFAVWREHDGLGPYWTFASRLDVQLPIQ